MGSFTQFLASYWQIKNENLGNLHVTGLKIGLLPLILFAEGQSCDHVQPQRRLYRCTEGNGFGPDEVKQH